MLYKPVSQLTEEDIKTLVDNHERESSILEYKREIFGADHEKKEFSKDISAMANAEGGYLIIGIEEADGQAGAIVGTPKVIGRQPVEVWIENVLIANVRPKISITPKVITLTGLPDRVVVVIHIPQSPRRPHMVIADGKNAYYVRHNYQATYADEHEVRAMFTESKNLGEEMKTFLASRNLDNSSDSNFGINPLSEQLPKSLRRIEQFPGKHAGNPFILFSACPRYLEERIDIASDDFKAWLETNSKVNLLDLNIDFLSYDKIVSADSIRSVQEVRSDKERLIHRYVEIFRNGYLENGTGPEMIWPHRGEFGVLLNLSYLTASLWMFLKFASKLYEKTGYLDEINLIVSLVDVENLILHGFGEKSKGVNWHQPYDWLDPNDSRMSICRQKNVKIERNVIASELNEENIEKIVKDMSKRISNAFGESMAKCFNDDGVFHREGLRGFRNVH